MEEWEVQYRLKAVLQGEPERFAAIVETFTPALFNFAAKMTGRREDAGEVVQETFFRAYRDLARFDGRARFLSWLFGICVNICRDQGKARRRERPLATGDAREEAVSPVPATFDEQLAARRDEERLRRCLSDLPVTLRAAVLLRYHEDLSLADVARRLKIGLSAAKMRVHRGLDLLRECMESGSRRVKA